MPPEELDADHLIAHGSTNGFLTGAGFGAAAILAAVFRINVTKTDLPAEPTAGAAVH